MSETVTPTPDNTRRETIEAVIWRWAGNGISRHMTEEIIRDLDASLDAALASAEPQAREASEIADFDAMAPAIERSEVEFFAELRRTRPAPAPAAETEGLIERPPFTDDEAKLWGLLGQIEAELRAPDEPEVGHTPFASWHSQVWNHIGHLAQEVERLKREADGQFVEAAVRVMRANPGFVSRDYAEDGISADDFEMFFTEDMNEAWRQVETLTAQLAARTQPPEIAEALACLVADVDALMRESAGVAGLHLNGDVAEWSDIADGGRHEGWLRSLEPARRLLASTGSRQEPAGEPVLTPKWERDYHRALCQQMPDAATSKLGLALTDIDRLEAALRSQPASRDSGEAMREAWWDPKTAPAPKRVLLRLLVSDENITSPLEDAEIFRTVGTLCDDGGWNFAGWDWDQDMFVSGTGYVIGWLPFGADLPAPYEGEQP